ncbi:TetR/AcrR family transcriptional regulator [Vulgatibacter sp.]|uniref:TetR/AcrR family transcriptional regulator n=1 Tax=Vulgatibacter sp. TaxID=1971226 RepID=UPI00356A7FAF
MGRAEQKAETRERILASAGKLLRERGIAAASVQEVMKGAGLTVGGFYAHFASKEALVDETIRGTIGRARGMLLRVHEESAIEGVIRRYLSRRHRDEAEVCPLPAIAGEIASGAPHGTVLAEELAAHARALAELLPAGGNRRERALGLLALLFGGLTLARATRGTALSDEILKACRAFARDGLAAEDERRGT